MKATNQSTLSSHLSTKSPKFATLTALAAACTMLLSAPINAAETDTTKEDAVTTSSVPSATDSSKRVFRRSIP